MSYKKPTIKHFYYKKTTHPLVVLFFGNEENDPVVVLPCNGRRYPHGFSNFRTDKLIRADICAENDWVPYSEREHKKRLTAFLIKHGSSKAEIDECIIRSFSKGNR